MTQDEIIEMARQAGYHSGIAMHDISLLEVFAKLVAAKEREAWATPVKIVQYNCTCGKTMKFESEHGVIAPQRTWVGLTDEEENEYNYLGPDMHWVIQEIAAKLKKKNT